MGVGIVGLSASGGWAAAAHVPAVTSLGGFELRGLVASTSASAAAAGEKFGVPKAFDSVDDLVAQPEVDLVVVTVKVPEHRQLVRSAIAAGKAVLCEWPLGNGLAETIELADAARAAGTPAFVGLQARSAPTVRYLRDLVADGYIGDILSTSVIGSGGAWGATVSEREEYTLDDSNGATMLTIPFGHTADAVAMVLGEFDDVTATTATRRRQVINSATGESVPMTAEDQIAVTGVLETGAVASIHFRGGMCAATNLLWEINGTRGDLRLTGNSGHLQLAEVELFGSRDGAVMAPLPVPDRYRRIPHALLESAPRAYNVAEAYLEIEQHLSGRAADAPTFDHAVTRYRQLERVRVSSTSTQQLETDDRSM
ncbi:Gfo/Idh/MocA family oxidoreductase [Nocardia veterana]|uniref:Gfo/Idh/MocA family oxidoreductase n=1 Tax=Nocardia veterana TaxID=132249 RepID=A0A7X6LZR8_9NOCA|nr:Gfo/Idh/MocA family oxidoreductase [Nocardia veterana]